MLVIGWLRLFQVYVKARKERRSEVRSLTGFNYQLAYRMIVSSTEMAEGVSDSSNREQPNRSAAFCPIGHLQRRMIRGSSVGHCIWVGIVGSKV